MLSKSLVALVLLFGCCNGSQMVVQTIGEEYGTWFPMKISSVVFNLNTSSDFYLRFNTIPVCDAPGYTMYFYQEKTAMLTRQETVVKKVTGEDYVIPNNLIPYAITFNHETGEIAASFGLGKEPFLIYKDPQYLKPSYFGIYTTEGKQGVWSFHFEGTLDCACYDLEIPEGFADFNMGPSMRLPGEPPFNPYRYVPRYPDRSPVEIENDACVRD